jgi:AcrR family transcriptional regulator
MVENASKVALLAAAKRLIAERGYAGASVRDLAAASGTNLAAVSYHFGSREELLNQAVLESFLEWTDRLSRDARADPQADPLARMSSSMGALLQDLPENQPLFAAFLEALLQARRSPQLHEQLAAHYAEQRRRVSELIGAEHASAAREGGERAERMVEVVASLLIAVVDGLQLQALLDADAVPTGEELTALLRGLASGAAGRKRSVAVAGAEGR